MNIIALLDELRQPGARVGTGVWLIPMEYINQERDIAARLGVQSLDVRQTYLEQLPRGTNFSGLTSQDGYQKLARLIQSLAFEKHQRDCLLIYTLDLLLWALEFPERKLFWDEVLGGIPYPHTRMILTIPEHATELFSFELRRHYSNQVAEGLL
ncbi:hypothetical protein [Roseiflexus sp.]